MIALAAALAEHRDGHALPRAFALDAEIHERELSAIWRRSWLFAGVSVEAPEPGDFFLFELGDDAVVIVRDESGELHALHNTCRHRGMPVCSARSGRVRRWVCPYHQWSYGLDGRLLTCGGMEDQLDAAAYGLRRAGVAEVEGLVFVWLDGDPDAAGELGDPGGPGALEAARAELATALAVQGLTRAKVAHRIDYEVAANWKLIWENNRECWHCHAGHPEYVRANFDTAPDGPRVRELVAARAREHDHALAGLVPAGVDSHERAGLYSFPTPGRWWSANRTPTAPGYVTESLDGQPVAPLMGDYPAHDVGTLRVRTVPNFWAHASSDHAVLTRLLPRGPEHTSIRVTWLVDGAAQEERDYELDRLLPFWQLTSEQDWSLCERNHAGVRNPAFTPGPYSLGRERNVAEFVRWYLGRMASA